MNIKLLVLLLAGILMGCNKDRVGNQKVTNKKVIRHNVLIKEMCLNGVSYYFHYDGGIHPAYDIKHKLISCKTSGEH